MITIENLTKTYGSKVAVDHLTFQVQPGMVTGFLGPNGAGKSTTMRMMLGLERPTAGTVRYGGRSYSDSPQPLRTVGALLDTSWVHSNRSAKAHLAWIAASNSIPTSRVGEVLETVGLSDVARKRAGSFSLGMRQRLGLAAALLGDPRYLLFDEPVNGLDPEGIHWIRRIMRRLAAEGRTVLVSSHLLSEMAQTADHLVVIGAGRLIADTSVKDFIGQDGPTAVRVRAQSPQELCDALLAAGASGCVVTQDDAGPLLRVNGLTNQQVGEIASRSGIPVFEIAAEQASLEEVFMRRTASAVEYQAASADSHGNDSDVDGGTGRREEMVF